VITVRYDEERASSVVEQGEALVASLDADAGGDFAIVTTEAAD
jgi:hypothetical protein